jgi:hypothetical protein
MSDSRVPVANIPPTSECTPANHTSSKF